MIARQALELAASEVVERLAITRAQQACHLVAVVVDRLFDRLWSCDRGETKLRRRHDESLVDKDLCAFRMIDGHQTDVVVVVNFPEFGGDTYVVIAVMRNELIAADLVPLASRRNLCGTERVDAQADRGAPRHRVFYKLHLLAVPGKQPRARRLQTLLSQYFLICFYFKLGAHSSVGPNYADHVGTSLLTQPEVNQWSGYRLLLYRHAGANFHLAADTEWIYTLIADGIARTRTHDLPVIILCTFIYFLARSKIV